MNQIPIYLALAILPIAGNAQDIFVDDFTVAIVCDSHADLPDPPTMHMQEGGKLRIKKIGADYVIEDRGGLSTYDWSDLKLQKVGSKPYPGKDPCRKPGDDLAGAEPERSGESRDGGKTAGAKDAGVETGLGVAIRALKPGRRDFATAAGEDPVFFAKQLISQTEAEDAGWERLTGKTKFRGHDDTHHVVDVYVWKDRGGQKKLFIQYVSTGPIHAGHVHN